MATLLIADGPASGQRIENVDPTDERWYVQAKPEAGGKSTHWWAWDPVLVKQAEEDEDLTVTRYRCISVRADHSAAEGDPSPTIHTYVAANE